MEEKMKTFLILILLLITFTVQAAIFEAPLPDVEVWTTGNSSSGYTVHYRVWDPDYGTSGEWRESSASPYDSGEYNYAIQNLTNNNGVIAWTERYSDTSSGQYLYVVRYAIYDPTYSIESQRWRIGSRISYDQGEYNYAIQNLTNSDGVIAWIDRYSDTSSGQYLYVVRYSFYDPIYSIESQRWRVGTYLGYIEDTVSSFSITNSTVYFEKGGNNYTRGYRADTGNWGSNPTYPIACFVASPISGDPPLRVWFMDMSIGSGRTISFGDGGSTSDRSPLYTYQTAGEYTATQNVTLSAMSDSYSLNISVTGYPNFSVSPTSHNYENLALNSNQPQNFVISNSGDGTLDISSQSITGTNADCFSILSGGGTASILPGQSHTTTVNYNPVYYGSHSATLSISHNDTGSPTNISLSGSCLAVPETVTDSVSNVSWDSAIINGSVTSDGGSNVIAKGVCWSEIQNPSLTDDFTDEGSGTNAFFSEITDLIPETLYYVRAYATNANGTSYGTELNFVTTAIPPDIPANVSISQIASYCLLTWDEVTNADFFNIYRSETPYPLDWGEPIATTTSNSYFDLDSINHNRYFYHIKSVISD